VHGRIGLKTQMMQWWASRSAMKSLCGGLALNSCLGFTKIDLVVFVRIDGDLLLCPNYWVRHMPTLNSIFYTPRHHIVCYFGCCLAI